MCGVRSRLGALSNASLPSRSNWNGSTTRIGPSTSEPETATPSRPGNAEATRAWAGPTLAQNPERNGPATFDLLFARHAERLAVSPRQHRPYMAFALLVKVSEV